MKWISLILAVSIILQSCAVYKGKSVSLEEAAKTHKRVLMIRNNDQKVRLKKIEYIDGQYYGVTIIHRQKTKILLDEKDIRSLRPIDRVVTTLGNIGCVFLVFVVISFAVYLSDPVEIDFGDDTSQ